MLCPLPAKLLVEAILTSSVQKESVYDKTKISPANKLNDTFSSLLYFHYLFTDERMPHIKTIPLTEIIFSNAKLLMAVTFSMIITLTLDCTLAQGQRTNSLFQTIFLDFLRDVSLQARYDYYQGRSECFVQIKFCLSMSII